MSSYRNSSKVSPTKAILQSTLEATPVNSILQLGNHTNAILYDFIIYSHLDFYSIQPCTLHSVAHQKEQLDKAGQDLMLDHRIALHVVPTSRESDGFGSTEPAE